MRKSKAGKSHRRRALEWAWIEKAIEEHRKRAKEAKPVKVLDTSRFWDEHVENVRPAIMELDRKQEESLALAPMIPVSNAPTSTRHSRINPKPRRRE